MPSIAEIARCAEVSRCTASQILNRSQGHERFSAAVRERVQSIADRLGWTRDSRGLALQQGRTGILALAMNWDARETGLMKSLVGAIERAARRHDRYLLIIGGPVAEAVAAVHSHRCDGVLAIGWNLATADAQALATCPHAVLCRVPEGLSGVDLDLNAGLIRAVSHLHGLGHRRIGFLHAESNEGHDLRWDAVRRAAARLGLASTRMPFPAVASFLSEEEEIARMRTILGGRITEITRCSAVICYNELVAASLISATAGMLRVPDDLSVIGIDDVHAPLVQPPLTCVSFSLQRLAEAAVTQVLRPPGRLRRERLPCGLSVRASCAAPR